MPLPPRDLGPGIFHVWVGATGDELYFRDEVDRIDWIRRLVRTLYLHGWTCIGFCQLGTHVHAIVSVPDQSLAIGMKRLNYAYSRDFNDRHDRRGQLLRRRYGSRRITDGTDLLGVYAYVALNPVAVGLCPRPEDWRWSSYATTIGLSHDFEFVNASLATAEAGGSTERLRAVVDGRHRNGASSSAMAGV